MFLIKNDVDLLYKCGFLKDDINPLCSDFKTLLMEQNEKYLVYIKTEEEFIIESFSNK